MMDSVVQEPTNLDKTSEENDSETNPISYMQSFNTVAMRRIFSNLNTKDIVNVSRVCTSWNVISKDKIFWRHVNLKDIQIKDWNILIDTMIRQHSTTLNTKCMLIPSMSQDFEQFWTNFIFAIKRATQLCQLELFRCPTNVVQECIVALPQLSVFNSSSIINPNFILLDTNGIQYQDINLSCVNQMVNLTILKLKAVPGIKLKATQSVFTFENLTKLRTLSLTSFTSFSTNICRTLETVITSLEHLEIGDCDRMPDDLPVSIKRFTNLKTLRLENCVNKEKEFKRELLVSIRSLKKLKTLEFVNIEITDFVEELGKCTNLDSLLIIPMYVSDSAVINRTVIDSLEKLSKTLKYFVWGLTFELLHKSDVLIDRHLRLRLELGKTPDLSLTRDPYEYILILKESLHSRNESNFLVIFSVLELKNLLKVVLSNAKTAVIKVPFLKTTEVSIQEHFKEIKNG